MLKFASNDLIDSKWKVAENYGQLYKHIPNLNRTNIENCNLPKETQDKIEFQNSLFFLNQIFDIKP